MREIFVDLSLNQPILDQINKEIKGKIESDYNEQTLSFDNQIGKGTIRNIDFEWGISLLDYDVRFKEELKIVYKLPKSNPTEFLFVSEGSLSYASNQVAKENLLKLQRYQNIILSNLPNSNNTFIFPDNELVKLNIIKIEGKKYQGKSNNYIDSLQKSLQSIIEGEKQFLPYKHLGNFNLRLAEIIEKLNDNEDNGIIRFLNIEGQLNLILALQILEHKSFENKSHLPNSINKKDLLKTKEISEYISENLDKYHTVVDLAEIHNFSSKKMQAGFKLLYGKTVNEYIRDKKLESARNLIEESDLSISEIVYKVGYRSRSYFSKIFYETYNVLPTKYKELLNEK